MKQRIIVAGGSGFLGKALAGELLKHDYEVIVLTRSPHERSDGVREVLWDAKNLGDWAGLVDGSEVAATPNPIARPSLRHA